MTTTLGASEALHSLAAELTGRTQDRDSIDAIGRQLHEIADGLGVNPHDDDYLLCIAETNDARILRGERFPAATVEEAAEVFGRWSELHHPDGWRIDGWWIPRRSADDKHRLSRRNDQTIHVTRR